MKRGWATLLLAVLALLFAVGIWTPSKAQALEPLDPAAEQISLIITFVCPGPGAYEDFPPLCSDSVLVDADGSHVMRLPGGGGAAWSPDGKQFLARAKQFLAPGPGADIFVVPATGGTGVNLTNDPANDLMAAWSPDGTKIAFASDREGPLDLYLMNPDGSGVVRINTGVGMAWKPTWSPDSTRLAFNCIVDSSPSPWWSAEISTVDVCAINADGSGFARLTTTTEPGGGFDPAWSPDGGKILFATYRYGGVIVMDSGGWSVSELAKMNPDGSGVTRVSPGTVGYAPAWSSDGTRIAFVSLFTTDWWGPSSVVYVMNADGTSLFELAWGDTPAWRPMAAGVNDRPVASFTVMCSGVTCTFDASASADSDGTIAVYAWHFGDGATGLGASASHTFAGGSTYTVQLIVMDAAGALGSVSQSVNLNQPPIVSFTSTCNGLTCTFDGSASFDPDGTIAMYRWNFGDGKDGVAQPVSHTYAAAGTYTVMLTVTDTAYGTGTQSQTITLKNPPVASFTYACNGLTCTFDGSASSDPGGTITSHAWTFGDGTGGSGATVSHTYSVGIYPVTLTVTDNGGATGTKSMTVMLNQAHVGDLDRASTNQGGTWTAIATATIHDTGHGAVANATVSGSWSDGAPGACTTIGSGQCTVSKPGITKKTGSVTFTVANVMHATLTYKPADNHDPDGDSTGTSINVSRP
jgi:PKD repeat protein